MRHDAVAPLLAALSWVVAISPTAADVVEFVNGDRLTGEVKSLDRGRLQFDTTATGVIAIEWSEVAFLQIDDNMLVETQSGDRYFGLLKRSDTPYEVAIETATASRVIGNDRVIAIDQIDAEGFRNIDLRVSAGYNYTNASNATQFNVGVNSAYRTRERILSGDFASTISNSAGNDVSQRQSLSLNYTRLRANRWLNDGGLSFDRNDELGLTLRTSLAAGGGRILTQSNSRHVVLKGGLKATRENNASQSDDLDSLESYGLLSWEQFRYDSPKLNLAASAEIIPSLTESGRVRGQLNLTLSWEIFGDLSWQLDFYDSYDNEPQSAGASRNDYGVTTSVSYDF
jgi:hypothetical protein